jgi:hypothetical protein
MKKKKKKKRKGKNIRADKGHVQKLMRKKIKEWRDKKWKVNGMNTEKR